MAKYNIIIIITIEIIIIMITEKNLHTENTLLETLILMQIELLPISSWNILVSRQKIKGS